MPGAPDPTQHRQARAHKLRECWHKTVGAFATDERGTTSLLDRLVAIGQLTADEAKRVLAEARARIDANTREVDRLVDESVKKLTARFESGELRALKQRIRALEDQIRALEGPASNDVGT